MNCLFSALNTSNETNNKKKMRNKKLLQSDLQYWEFGLKSRVKEERERERKRKNKRKWRKKYINTILLTNDGSNIYIIER